MKFLSEFKQFAMRGNVMDLAIAVVIGASFGKIVSSLVDGILMPLLGLMMGGIDISDRVLKIGDAVIKWGAFLQTIFDFTLIALAIFLAIKFINILQLKQDNEPQKLTREEAILIEIRDLLRINKQDNILPRDK